MPIQARDLQLDAHTHTLASGHAYGTIREMAAAASEQGLRLLGISEHAPGTPGTCDPLYFINLEVVPREIGGVRLLLGSEVNILEHGRLSLEPGIMAHLDYGIAGFHRICYTPGTKVSNTEDALKAISDPHIQILCHPDDGKVPLDYPALVKAAKELHVLLEVNNNSLRHRDRRLGCVENYRVMLSLCAAEGVPILVSSDAHDPSDVKNFRDALELLNEIGFPPELVINSSMEQFLNIITGKPQPV